ncbi:hypothetical protein F4779DRAFT_628876 [Xylariaceae sp. FL0662B]|nr:hypothetical protein F4779DRAFT_628876 [Xylariaceae sp. FL0662B]
MNGSYVIAAYRSCCHSFGDPNAQPPTPKQTPTSAGFPSSVFETPKNNRASFEDSSGWTPRFAEEYSVFNSTPGNLRGSQGPFVDFSVSSPYQPSSQHKRPLSAESIAAEIATHATHFSSDATLPLPPVDPSRRLPSSPGPLLTGESPTEVDFQAGSHNLSAKKVRRGTLLEAAAQTATPPPSTHKGKRRLAPKLQTDTMQNEGFEQEFVAGTPQQQPHLQHYAAAQTDMFGYPMSAPATAPGFGESRSFWDSDMTGMEMDFSGANANMFQTHNHRPMNSLDWGKSNEIFQETGVVPPQNQENNPPAKKERPLAPKPPTTNMDTSVVDSSMFSTSYVAPVEDPFALMSQGGGVDPGLLFTRPPSSSMEPATFDPMAQPPLLQSFSQPEPLVLPVKQPKRGAVRRKKTDRLSASSPIKPSGRGGLSRSFSENKGRKPVNRTSNLPNLAPAARPISQAGSGRSTPQSSRSGRTSPLKNHHRLSSLTSIPEATGPRTQTSVKFIIDSRVVDDEEPARAVMRRQRESGSNSRNCGSSEDDESSTDDEPIIIPSRNNSFAVPEPRDPSAASYLSSQRSASERSASSLGIYNNEPGIAHDDPESEAETVMNVTDGSSRHDATSELRKVVENRQKRASLNTNQRFVSGGPYSASSTMSSTTMADGSLPTPSSDGGNRIRCVCNTTSSSGYMVQCESCEMWLHGKCINITRQTLPRVYVCAFCANTPNAHGMRGREIRRSMGGSNPRVTASSPLAHKSFNNEKCLRRSELYEITNKLTRTHTLIYGTWDFKMASYNIVVFGGDHCGPEVVAEAIKVLKAIESNSPNAGKLNLQEHLIGGCSINAHGTPLTDAALEAAKAADAVLLGAIGGPEWGTGASLVEHSPLKAEVCRGTDFTVVRELTGGIYFGDRREDDGDGVAWDTEPYTRAEVERIARLAAHLALAREPPAPVWSLDKANVLATSRLWRRVVSEVLRDEFPQLTLRHQLIDSAAMAMVRNPRGLNGVVVTSNLFGDIVSDEASVIPGSIGLSPSASLSGIPDGKSRCNGIYEPIHGSAPDISGKGIVNPVGTILSIAMMCRYSLRLPKEADAIETAVRHVIDGGVRTKDLGGSAGTEEMGDAVVAELVKILKA